MGCFGSSRLICIVELLDDSEIKFSIMGNSKGQCLMDKVCSHLNLLEKDYFGLRFLDRSKNYHWLDLQKNIIKQIKRLGFNQSADKFYFGVKFYAADPCKLSEEVTRYLLFLQVKRDVLNGRISVSFDHMAELCALAVQSEFGDFDSKVHTSGYVSELSLAPQQSEDLEEAIMESHKKLSGFLPSACEYMYLDKIKWQEMYGVDLYRVKGDKDSEYFIGLTPSGVVIYKHLTKVAIYYWPRISGINFKKKEFSLQVKDKNSTETTYAFSFDSRDACKHLWKCCVEHHSFFRLIQTESSTFSFFNLSSKFRYSGRTEKQLACQESLRSPLNVERTLSQRRERRNVVSISSPSNTVKQDSPKLPGKEIQTTRQLDDQASAIDSFQNSFSFNSSSQFDASWLSTQGGMFTSGKDSPKSIRSEKMKFPTKMNRTDSCSETDSYIRKRFDSPGYEGSMFISSHPHGYHHRRESDNESERSAQSRRRRRRYHRSNESGSDAESMHRRRRHNDHHSHKGAHCQDSLCDQNSMCSGLSAPITAPPHTRHSRRRSQRSNLLVKAIAPEIKAHIKFELVDADRMDGKQLLDIPYTKVRTCNDGNSTRASPTHSHHSNRSKKCSHHHHHHHHRHHHSHYGSEKSHHHHRNENVHHPVGGYENISYDKSGSPKFTQASYDSDATVDQEIAKLLGAENNSPRLQELGTNLPSHKQKNDTSEREPIINQNDDVHHQLAPTESVDSIKHICVAKKSEMNQNQTQNQRASHCGDYSNLEDFASLIQNSFSNGKLNHQMNNEATGTKEFTVNGNSNLCNDRNGFVQQKRVYKQIYHRDPPHIVKTHEMVGTGKHHSPALHVTTNGYKNHPVHNHQHAFKVSQI